MNTYEQLKTRICELVPEILELKFGCKVSTEYGEFIIGGKEISITSVHKGTKYEVNYFVTSYGRKEIIKENFEIIGRDITLEDVMIILSRRNIKYRFDETFEFYVETEYIYWLRGKPLHLQSEETQKAILELIK